MEEWRGVPEYPGYEVSNYGNIRSLDRVIMKSNGISKTLKGGPMKSRVGSHGYLILHLSKDRLDFKGRERKVRYVHRLVAAAFLSNPKNKPQVNHINGKKTDNRVCNLEWVTLSEQMEHAVNTGLVKKKEPNTGLSKLNVEQVKLIRDTYENKSISMKQLGLKYNVSRKCISKVVNRISYKHV